MRYICGKATSSSCASEIVKSVNFPIAIEWGKQAWDKVAGTTITKWFKKTGLHPDSEVVDDDPFEGEDNQELGALLTRLNSLYTADQYIAEEDDGEVCQPLKDSSELNWRQTVLD